jgi:tRNA nucleotidyltransferase (CCA-adding enzyme)
MLIDDPVHQLCRAVSAAGGRALLVGGWVRDSLRGCPRGDYDLEVYHLAPQPLRKLLEAHGSVNPVGAAYTVYKVRLRHHRRSLVVDVGLPRRESKIGRGHRGFVVTGDPFMSYEEAARRRDFTINAILFDPLTAEVIDPFAGQADLRERIIRLVDPATFVEDSLRVLRAMQFAARLEFTIDPQTIAACREIDLHDLPAERIWGEVEKWLLHSGRPSIGLRAARELGIIDQLWPELQPLDLAALARSLDAAVELIAPLDHPRRIAVMLATLCRNFTLGLPAVERFLDRLCLYTVDRYDTRRQILALVAHRQLPQTWATASPSDGDYRRLALEVEPGLLARVEAAAAPDQQAAIDGFLDRVRQLGVEIAAPPPLLLGRHLLQLGHQPGPHIGEITRAVYQLQLDDRIRNLDEAIAAARSLTG